MPAISGVGIGILGNILVAQSFFALCVRLHSLVGRAKALKSAPVISMSGYANLVRLRHPFITAPSDHHTDFTELADNCERFCEAMLEEEDQAVRTALCGRLATCLALLKPTRYVATVRQSRSY